MGFGPFGGPEIVGILILALLLFGAKRVPELMKSFGQGLREFKKSVSGIGEDITAEEDKASTPKTQ